MKITEKVINFLFQIVVRLLTKCRKKPKVYIIPSNKKLRQTYIFYLFIYFLFKRFAFIFVNLCVLLLSQQCHPAL